MKRSALALMLALSLVGCATGKSPKMPSMCHHQWETVDLWVFQQTVEDARVRPPTRVVSLLRCKLCHVLGSEYEKAVDIKDAPTQVNPKPVDPAQAPRSGTSITIPAEATTH